MREAEKRVDAHYIAPFLPNVDIDFSSGSKPFLTGFKIWSYYKFYSKSSLSAVVDYLSDMQQNKISLISVDELYDLLPKIYHQVFENINDHEKHLALSQFQKIEQMQSLSIKCLAKDRLYYQQVKSSSGSKIGSTQFVRLSYTLKTNSGMIIEDQKEGVMIDLSRTMKAFRASLPFMSVGEQGILFIHPDWGIKDYLSPPYISPYLIAEFKVLDAM